MSEEAILALVKDGTIEDSVVCAKDLGVDHQVVVGILKSLAVREAVLLEQNSEKVLVFTEDGKTALEKGSPEYRYFQIVTPEGITKAQAIETLGKATEAIGFKLCMKNKWLMFKKPTITRKVEAVEDTVQQQLLELKANAEKGDIPDAKTLKPLSSRKLLSVQTIKKFKVERGPKFEEANVKKETDLSIELLRSGDWKTATFKEYNFNAKGLPTGAGALHPLQKMRVQVREIFIEMGFSEMPTNNYVESSFWNFDSLFQPQQHPARDAHDTFFIQKPATAHSIPADYLERVKSMHEKGSEESGSIGWRYDWSEEESKKNILRTHTTAVSSRMLYKLAQSLKDGGEFEPKKYFSIDRVFRNESLDATHLAEFHQIEGLIADKDLTLGNLIGVISVFFEKVFGVSKLRFKPAYNPYTEPSMEMFCYHEGLGKWIEIGNSGMFRPEMLRPMGLPPNVRVIAWGLSLERPTMIKYGINNIRSLCGHKLDIKQQKDNPICILSN